MDENFIDRRTFIATGTSAVAALLVSSSSAGAQDDNNALTVPQVRDIVLVVNGVRHSLQVDTRMTLLDSLREKVGLTGSKKGCDQGQCGACTIHIDGERRLSCLTLSVAAQGHQITTIEGLARDGHLHPMQQAFIEHDAFQCGYCTSGQIMSAVACVREGHASTDDSIREYMSGNLCRCAAYPNIVTAIKQAKTKWRRADAIFPL